MGCGNRFFPDQISDRADETDLPIRGLQHGFHDIGRGGLPIGTRHSDHPEGGRGISIKSTSQNAQGCPGILHANARHRSDFNVASYHDRYCPRLHHSIQVLVAVDPLSLHGDEQRPWLNLSGIIGQRANDHVLVPAPFQHSKTSLNGTDQFIQRHVRIPGPP